MRYSTTARDGSITTDPLGYTCIVASASKFRSELCCRLADHSAIVRVFDPLTGEWAMGTTNRLYRLPTRPESTNLIAITTTVSSDPLSRRRARAHDNQLIATVVDTALAAQSGRLLLIDGHAPQTTYPGSHAVALARRAAYETEVNGHRFSDLHYLSVSGAITPSAAIDLAVRWHCRIPANHRAHHG